MEISNNALAGLVVLAIVVVLVGTVMTANFYSRLGIPITGQPISQTGTARVSLEQNIDITLTQTVSDFGILRNTVASGSLVYVSNRSCCGWNPGASCPYAVTAGGNWTSVTGCGANGSWLDAGRAGAYTWQTDGSRAFGQPMVLNNTGTDDANVDIASTSDASFLGGSIALRNFSFGAREEPPDACMLNPVAVNNSFATYIRFIGSSKKQPLCRTFEWGQTGEIVGDSIAVIYELYIPYDATRSPLSTTITFTGCRTADANAEGNCP